MPGWILASNYTGPDNSCVPLHALEIRNISISFKGLSVETFSLAVVKQFPRDLKSWEDVQVYASGKLHGLTHLMDDLASLPAGFSVTLLGREEFFFRRSVS